MKPNYSHRMHHIPTSFIREILAYANKPGVISFAGGIPEEQIFPYEEIQFSMNEVMRKNATRGLQYGLTEGNTDLRELIAMDYRKKGIPITSEHILITSGSQQGLDLVAKLFLNKGDRVLLEAPSYLGAIQCFSQYECEFDEILLHPDGPDLDVLLEKIWEQTSSHAFMYMVPDFQNPTGYQYTLEKRKQVGEILKRANCFILEDRPYAELNYGEESLPEMLQLFPDQTIQLGSFSKILTPGMRTGWIAAPLEIIKRLKLLKQASDLHSNGLVQEIILDLKSRGVIERHLPLIKKVYQSRRDAMCSELSLLSDFLDFEIPNGGMFCWASLKNGTAEELNWKCIQQDLVFVPGHHFYATNKNEKTIRLNFSKNEESVIRKGIQILKESYSQESTNVRTLLK